MISPSLTCATAACERRIDATSASRLIFRRWRAATNGKAICLRQGASRRFVSRGFGDDRGIGEWSEADEEAFARSIFRQRWLSALLRMGVVTGRRGPGDVRGRAARNSQCRPQDIRGDLRGAGGPNVAFYRQRRQLAEERALEAPATATSSTMPTADHPRACSRSRRSRTSSESPPPQSRTGNTKGTSSAEHLRTARPPLTEPRHRPPRTRPGTPHPAHLATRHSRPDLGPKDITTTATRCAPIALPRRARASEFTRSPAYCKRPDSASRSTPLEILRSRQPAAAVPTAGVILPSSSSVVSV
jgi:hypothetical protein